jgi:hypothetical protein
VASLRVSHATDVHKRWVYRTEDPVSASSVLVSVSGGTMMIRHKSLQKVGRGCSGDRTLQTHEFRRPNGLLEF